MIFCFFDGGRLGTVAGDRVTPIPETVVPATTSPQERLLALIDGYAAHRDELAALATDSTLEHRPVAEATLEAPVPSPRQLLCAVKNYADDRQGVAADFFLKSPLSIVPTGATVSLPPVPARVFHHEPELAAVIGTGGRDIPAAEAMSHVFGYTGFLDLSARDVGTTYYMKKSFHTFGPMGPVLVTADEIPDPHDLTVELSVNGKVRQRYSTGQMANRIDRLIEVASSVSGIAPGDVIATGTYHIGMGPVQGGDHVRMSVERIGELSVDIVDPSHRSWPVPTGQAVTTA
ncbi:fumarylacetoacetate hydrolase family protein [Phytohabitans sp. ZYX-F-186]|uniref:Fumarylacetoacetate hydrolase family protein n=1 Tax=Phytohabitans maris TaxID=3071409 RepID=A0ABU0ZC37_9ACTN|nr:fumarylacetoacetate hydrolase family protein [Phytohabitans sp. ZYX-F-186]MDQ7904624.1 fumarylacetoacetate hydrolase family protein [Phytohabitans sp. ZYX-F-186]